EPLSQRNNKVEDVADGVAKSINFSFGNHDDGARIGNMRFSTSNESVQIREAEARKGFDLFREFARCVVLSYNWDGIAME
ncbi:unnamed protein product, partial [Prunus brigantina]